MGFICLLTNKEIVKPLVTNVASGFFILYMSGMHNGCVLVCKTSVVSSILTPDSWRCSKVGLCNGLKIRRCWFDTNRFHLVMFRRPSVQNFNMYGIINCFKPKSVLYVLDWEVSGCPQS